MTTLSFSSSDELSPIDVAEALFEARDWLFDRPVSEELLAEIAGGWCDYRVLCSYQPGLEALSFSCAFDTRVPESMMPKLHSLLASINEKLWIGHFDICSEQRVIMFRHGLLLRGHNGASMEQIEDLTDLAIHECDRFYPVFQSTIWGGEQFEGALDIALMETVGEA